MGKGYVCLSNVLLLHWRVLRRRRILRGDNARHPSTNLVRHRSQLHQGREDLVGVHPGPGHNDRPHVHNDHGDFARPFTVNGYRDVGRPGVSQCCKTKCPHRDCAKDVTQYDTPFPKHFPFNATRYMRGINESGRGYFFFLPSFWKTSSAWCWRISSWLRIDSGHCWYTP